MTPSFPTRRSSDLHDFVQFESRRRGAGGRDHAYVLVTGVDEFGERRAHSFRRGLDPLILNCDGLCSFGFLVGVGRRSEEHTSELQSLMRISYAVFCLKKKKKQHVIILANNT